MHKRAEKQSRAEAHAQLRERKSPQSNSIWKWPKRTHTALAKEMSARASDLKKEESYNGGEGAVCGTSVATWTNQSWRSSGEVTNQWESILGIFTGQLLPSHPSKSS